MAPLPLLLVYVDSRGAEHTIPLAGVQQAGRSSEAALHLDEEGVSRLHCEFLTDHSGSQVRDLDSTNGTFVNGSRVRTARLKSGDSVALGRLLMKVETTGVPNETSRTTSVLTTESVEVAIPASRTDYRPESLELATSRRHLQSLYGILSTIAASADMETMLEGVLQTILKTLELDFGHVLIGTSADDLLPAASCSLGEGKAPPHSRTVVRRVLHQQEAILANDIQAEPYLSSAESLVATGALRILCAPVPLAGAGVLYVASRGLGSPIDTEDVSFLNAAAHQIGLAAMALKEREDLARENELLRSASPTPRLVGSSDSMERLRATILKAAQVDATVLITGESGTGKELVARGIHDASPRRDRPFVALNCGAVAPSVVQSELFGHEKGAFTGADARRQGLVELAGDGTLFLDEIGELPAEVQVMLLRVLEEKRFYRVGGQREIRSGARFLAATNRNLDAMAGEGSFREDLLYRLKVVEIRTPALREHLEDLDEITDFLLDELTRTTGRHRRAPNQAARDALRKHRWPGNVRELRNALERALLLGSGPELDAPDLGLGRADPATSGSSGPLCSLSEVEKEHIQRILQATGWNKTRAAEILGVARITLYDKIRNYDLKPH